MGTDTTAEHRCLGEEMAALIVAKKGKISFVATCRSIGISQTLGREVLQGVVGEGFSRFSRRIRLENAGIQLSNTKESIWKVCLSAGFHSQSSLDHAFRSHFGCTPTDFRKLNLRGCRFPSHASWKPSGGICAELIDIGVFTDVGLVTTFTYDRYILVGRTDPPVVTY